MDGFGKWIELVQAEAKKHGRVFVLESMEGRERDDAKFHDGMEVQDLSGFLLTPEQAEAFADAIRDDPMSLHDMIDIDDVFISWDMDGDQLRISFERAMPWEQPEPMAL